MKKSKSSLSGSEKYKMTILKRMAEKNIRTIAQGYTSARPSIKDKRTKAITAGDKKRAMDAFKYVAEGTIKNNPNLTPTEIFEKITRTSQFNKDYRAENTKTNFIKQLREAGIRTQARSIQWDDNAQKYEITRGVNAGKHFAIVHNPGQEPSVQIIII